MQVVEQLCNSVPWAIRSEVRCGHLDISMRSEVQCQMYACG